MKKIGSGLFYKVYEVNNKKVLKQETSSFNKTMKICSWYAIPLFFPKKWVSKEVRKYNFLVGYSILTLKDKIKEIDKSIIGNPIFKEGITYKQDKVLMVKDIIKQQNVEDNKVIIDKYIECIFRTWENGFSDITFNFTIDNGINSKGDIILTGLSELTFNKKEVAKIIKDKKWLSQFSYKWDFRNKEIKQYYKEQMNKSITISNLKQYWKEQNL